MTTLPPAPRAPQAALDTERCPAQAPPAPASESLPAGLWLTGALLLMSTVALSLGLPVEPKRSVRLEQHTSMPQVGSQRSAPPGAPETRPPRAEPPRAHAPPGGSSTMTREAALPRARIEVRDLSLDVTARPSLHVTLDGKALGHTPKLHVQLRPGVHRILLFNRELQVRAQVTVQAEPRSREVQDIVLD